MSNLQQYQDQPQEITLDEVKGAFSPADSSKLIIDPQAFQQMHQFALVMAESRSMVPEHMRGNVGDCMAVTMQALQWGMNPFAVAQKTFNIKGVLGYEAQLINAVVTANAPITGRLQFEWFGPWERILGKFKEMPSKFEDKNGKKSTYKVPNWNAADEEGLGVTIWATLKGEENPRVLSILMTQALTRNSTLWTEDPKQQIAYLAIKRWARLYCPDVIMGVYSPDELRDRNAAPRDVTPKIKNTGSAGLLSRLTKPIPQEEAPQKVRVNPDEMLGAIKEITQLKQGASILAEIQSIEASENMSFDPADLKILMAELKKVEAPLRKEYKSIVDNINKAGDTDTLDRLREVAKDKAGDLPDDGKHLNDLINQRLKQLG